MKARHTLFVRRPQILKLAGALVWLLVLTTAVWAQTPTPGEAPDPTAPTKPAGGSAAPATKPLNDADKLGAVNVAGVDVSGLTVAEARDKLFNDLLPTLDEVVVLTDGATKLERTRQDLCVSLDVDGMLNAALAAPAAGQKEVGLKVKTDQATLRDYLITLKPDFAYRGRNAYIIDEGGEIKVNPGQWQRELDAAGTAVKIAAAFDRDPQVKSIQVALTKTPPRITAAAFKGINGRLARFTSDFDPNQIDRSENMRIAIGKIDGEIVPVDGVFSLNETVGERTPERGFRKAPIFEEGKVVQGYGGGVSQVTGTIFNAALFAGLDIVTYRTHSRPVRYLPIGRDATVAWGSFDMQWKNNTGAPIFIRYRIEGSQVVCTLYGKTNPDQKVTLEVKQRVLGNHRIDASLYRITTIGDSTKREHVGDSHYDWQD